MVGARVVGTAVVPPQRHLNGHVLATDGVPHGRVVHRPLVILSGVGDVLQWYVSHKVPEKPVVQGHVQVAALKVNPFWHVSG